MRFFLSLSPSYVEEFSKWGALADALWAKEQYERSARTVGDLFSLAQHHNYWHWYVFHFKRDLFALCFYSVPQWKLVVHSLINNIVLFLSCPYEFYEINFLFTLFRALNEHHLSLLKRACVRLNYSINGSWPWTNARNISTKCKYDAQIMPHFNGP